MTVTVNDLKVGPITPADGVSLISMDFGFDEDTWIEVYSSAQEDALVLGADYTVAGAGTGSGSITLLTPANGVDSYTILCAVPLERSSDLQTRGEFRSRPFNVEMDRVWKRLQYQWTAQGQKFGVRPQDDALEPLEPVADRLIGFDALKQLAVSGSTIAEADAAISFFLGLNGSADFGDANAVTFIPPFGVYAVNRSVSSKLAEVVSLGDFGARGDGVTDNTTALQECINWCSHNGVYEIFVPDGHFVFDTAYVFYHETLNPGYIQASEDDPPEGQDNLGRHGKIAFRGRGNLAVSDVRSYKPRYGSILEATGDGIVLSRASLGHSNPTSGRVATITAATQTNPVVLTSASHGLSNFQAVTITDVEGMTELNGVFAEVRWIDSNTFELLGVDATGFGAYTSGGVATREVGGFPARKFEARNMTFVANKADQYVIEAASCPFMSLQDCTIHNRHIDGHGLQARTMWFFDTHRTIIMGYQGDGYATGDGIHAGATLFGGLWSLTGGLVDTWKNGIRWDGGVFTNTSLTNIAIQSCWNNSILGESGTMQNLVVQNIYFEGGERVSDVKCNGGTIQCLNVNGIFVLAGAGNDATGENRFLSGPVIDLEQPASININDVYCFRLSSTFCNVESLNNSGVVSGHVSNFRMQNDTTYTGDTAFLFTGRLPNFGEGIYWPGYQNGYLEPTDTIRLFDPDEDWPRQLLDRRTGTTCIHGIAFGPSGEVETNGVAVYIVSGDPNVFHEVLSTGVAVACYMPETLHTLPGTMKIVKNSEFSSSRVVIRDADGTTVAPLQPGASAMIGFDPATGRWRNWLNGIAWQGIIGGITDSTGGTALTNIPAISGSGADAALNNAIASLIAQVNALNALIQSTSSSTLA